MSRDMKHIDYRNTLASLEQSHKIQLVSTSLAGDMYVAVRSPTASVEQLVPLEDLEEQLQA